MAETVIAGTPELPPGPDPERQAAAQRYGRLQRRAYLLELLTGAGAALAWWLAGGGRAVAEATPGPTPAVAVVAALALGGAYALATVPFDWYRGHLLPRRFKLSVQPLRGWLAQRAKAAAVAGPLGLGVVAFTYWALGAFPNYWWLMVAALLFGASVLLTVLSPVLLMPLFFRMTPLPEGAVRRRLLDLAERLGMPAGGVYVIHLGARTTATNAAVMGLGRTRRIVLGDTLLDRYTMEEIEAVMAHELGHHLRGDIPRSVAFQGALALASLGLLHPAWRGVAKPLGLEGMDDPAGLPVLALLSGGLGLLLSPLEKGYNRWVEAAADRFALRCTGEPRAFISMLARLHDQNLSEARPPRWAELLFWDHPPYYRRVAEGQRQLAAPGPA